MSLEAWGDEGDNAGDDEVVERLLDAGWLDADEAAALFAKIVRLEHQLTAVSQNRICALLLEGILTMIDHGTYDSVAEVRAGMQRMLIDYQNDAAIALSAGGKGEAK